MAAISAALVMSLDAVEMVLRSSMLNLGIVSTLFLLLVLMLVFRLLRGILRVTGWLTRLLLMVPVVPVLGV